MAAMAVAAMAAAAAAAAAVEGAGDAVPPVHHTGWFAELAAAAAAGVATAVGAAPPTPPWMPVRGRLALGRCSLRMNSWSAGSGTGATPD